ncbi:BRO-N domain-containing protein [Mycobacteroides abscessus]|uniref:BRO-N domain-containing protein n=1 Tax=Mycobacteroides abscessus TaxID=36809 RepID=UPI000C268FA8|nr:BRO family protein [Mycobacteroides abscessus]AWG51631.1 hypothetical protein DDT48_21080 [Mycobacteroides abscessus]MDM2383863.1 BRO family protein [Mycobacteroides abscessus]MDM2387275.1 BRO family protein [Mycobacteroides abscessus]MDO3135655.1 BRO family protein [Mycobacteroides abscessus subsp. abscessus]MDO3151053.1 BRO family protein [Mycobacteroides abscessus subsp. abscessus]
MTAPQLFSNGEFELPVLPDGDSFKINGTVVARQLGHRDASDMVRALDDDEKVLIVDSAREPLIPSELVAEDMQVNLPAGLRARSDQGIWYLTEPGFYKVIGQRNTNLIKDRKVREAVIRFQRWVFHDVLPQMMREGRVQDLAIRGSAWNWMEVSALVRQRYGLDYSPRQITRGLREAGWLKEGSTEPKRAHRDKFWFTGTAWHLLPYALPDLVRALVSTLQQIGDPQANQYQLNITPSLKALPGGES